MLHHICKARININLEDTTHSHLHSIGVKFSLILQTHFLFSFLFRPYYTVGRTTNSKPDMKRLQWHCLWLSKDFFHLQILWDKKIRSTNFTQAGCMVLNIIMSWIPAFLLSQLNVICSTYKMLNHVKMCGEL